MKVNKSEDYLHLSFHGMEPSETIRTKVREYVDKLQKRYSDITTWRVHVNGPTPAPASLR